MFRLHRFGERAMTRKLAIGPLVCLLSIVAIGSALATAEIPKFRYYPVDVYAGPVSAPDLSSHPQARTYRTRLRNAAKGQVNFAGEYIVTYWGCGTTCVDGAVLNARTGQVHFLPHNLCCWGDVDEGFRPIEVRPYSRLIVLAGLQGEEEPMGAHFYEFRDGEFRFIKTIETAPDFRR